MLSNAGYYHFMIGDIAAIVVSDGTLIHRPAIAGYAEGTSEELLIAALRDYHLPTDRMPMYENNLVLRTGSDLVLVDTGTGPGLVPTAGHLETNLRAAGIRPEEITAIVLTHAHPDHIGGIVTEAGGLRYPNARYFLADREWEYWADPDLDLTQLGLNDAEQALVHDRVHRHLPPIQDRLTLVTTGDEILPGIRSLAAPGHTPGHLALQITSNGDSLLHLGDAAHHAVLSFAYPDWRWRGDYDADQHIATRRRLFAQAAAERLRVFGFHLPFPGIGHIRESGRAYTWLPEPMELAA